MQVYVLYIHHSLVCKYMCCTYITLWCASICMTTTARKLVYICWLTQLFATDVKQSSCLSFPSFFRSRLCFHPYLVSVLFTGPSLHVVNFYQKFFTLSKKVCRNATAGNHLIYQNGGRCNGNGLDKGKGPLALFVNRQ